MRSLPSAPRLALVRRLALVPVLMALALATVTHPACAAASRASLGVSAVVADSCLAADPSAAGAARVRCLRASPFTVAQRGVAELADGPVFAGRTIVTY